MNRQILWCLLLTLIMIWPKPVLCQLPGNASLVLFPSTPTGNCNSRQLALDESNGSLYTCVGAAGGTSHGTWQIIAGGGGGGGWNPPTNTPGDTLFGNNTVGTGSPSFFTPGGDVSFSSGNFSVNSLHFGPNVFSLTNTGIATGNCLQVSGSSIIGGACGTGGGGGLSGSGTTNLIPKFTAATALGNSLLTDNGTTLTYTGTGGIVAPRVSITQGPFQLTSITGALPAPSAGQNGLVSGPDGWYFSNSGAAYALLGTGGAGTAGVTSFNTRTGPVLPAANDYTVAQVTGAAPLANPTFTGTAIAPAPSGAGAVSPGNNQIATTAFVFANAGGAASGVSSFNGRQGAVNPLTNDYNVSQVTGAAPLAGPIFSGVPESTTPPANDNSQKIATTGWIQANYGPSSGATGSVAIGHSAQTPGCYPQNNTSASTLDISVNIQNGDTVIVGVQSTTAYTTVTGVTTVTDNASPSSNVYIERGSRAYPASGSARGVTNLMATDAGAAHPANSIHVAQTLAGRFVACVATYVGVNSLGAKPTAQGPTPSVANQIGSISLPLQDDNGVMVSFAGIPVLGTPTYSQGTSDPTWQASATSPSTANGSLCEATASTAGTTVTCAAQWNNTTSTVSIWAAIELRPGVSAPAPYAGPKVVALHRANITVTTTAFDNTALFTCSATSCPPGFYRVAWDFLSLGAGCTGGALNINVDYFDEFDLNTAYHTGMVSGSGAAMGPGRNHVFGYRLLTVAKTFSSAVGIQFTTSAQSTSSSPCSSGTGTAQVVISVERLQ